MDETVVQKVWALCREAIEHLQRRDQDGAEHLFARAVMATDDIESPQMRRSVCGPLALRLLRSGFPNMASAVAKQAMMLDHQLDDRRHLGEDLLTYGSALSAEGQTDKAIEAFQQALDMFVKEAMYANAASASTNLAVTFANRGRLAESLPLLRKSLDYLTKEPFPDTEMTTRLALLQTMDALQQPAEESFRLARETLDRFGKEMKPAFRTLFLEKLKAIVERFLRNWPIGARGEWVKEHFRELEG